MPLATSELSPSNGPQASKGHQADATPANSVSDEQQDVLLALAPPSAGPENNNNNNNADRYVAAENGERETANSGSCNNRNNNTNTDDSLTTRNDGREKANDRNLKPPSKLNGGLKNRIIQRPPPLILDKVSNFYSNEPIGVTQLDDHTKSNHGIIKPSISDRNLDHQSLISDNNGQQFHSETQNGSTSNIAQQPTKNNSHQLNSAVSSNQINEIINNQLSTNIHASSSANHKFWASLNENASRNKAIASARGVVNAATSALSNPPLNIPASSSTTTITDEVNHNDTYYNSAIKSRLGADLIISDRPNTNGATGSLPHLFSKRHQQNQSRKTKTPEKAAAYAQEVINSASFNGFEAPTHLNAHNNSTESDTIHRELGSGGGVLIGVDNATSPTFNHRLEELPLSATLSRPRSNNPFLIADDDIAAQPADTQTSFHTRPASFIAATTQNNNNSEDKSITRPILGSVQEQFDYLTMNEDGHRCAKNSDFRENIFVHKKSNQNDQIDSQNIYGLDSMSRARRDTSLNQSMYGYHNYQEPAISVDSESTNRMPPPSAKLPHWTEASYRLNNAILESRSIKGGAEIGQFIYIGESGDIILEFDDIKVSGFTLLEFNELVESKQFHVLCAVQTKHSEGLTTDLKKYLKSIFPKNSEDKNLQDLVRENIYRRTIPCTTRPPRHGEVDRIDYHFLSVNQFLELENRDMLLESGVYNGHYYGTLRPLCDLTVISTFPMHDINHDVQAPRPLWDASHPAVGMVHKPNQPAFGLGENPLYANHESLKMQRQFSVPEPSITNNQPPLPSGRSSIVAVDTKALPRGWERVIDQTHGTYYIDHNTQKTQYEVPYEVELTKGSMGFGFTLVETDGGILLVRSVIPGGPASINGMIKPGDILISACGISVEGLQDTDIARLFSTLSVGDRVRLTFGRGSFIPDVNIVPDEYLFSNGTNGDLAFTVNTASTLNNHLNTNVVFSHSPHILVNQEFESITVSLHRGEQGFGFTVSKSMAGHKVQKIQNKQTCSSLKKGDVLTHIDGEDITRLDHNEVVEKLKDCPIGRTVAITVRRTKRQRSTTPTLLANDVSRQQTDVSPLRNCKTPNIDGLMLKRLIPRSPDVDIRQTVTAVSTANFGQYDNGLPTIPNNPVIYSTLPGATQNTLAMQQPSNHRTIPIMDQEPGLYYGNALNQQKYPSNDYPCKAAENNSLASNDVSSWDNFGSAAHPPESLSASNHYNPTNLNQLNQFNNFMNNDKLVMMQMQQKVQTESQRFANSYYNPMEDQQHVPLYSNSEQIHDELVNSNLYASRMPPPPPPPMDSFSMPNLYANQNNYYANNEQLAAQRASFADVSQPTTAPSVDPFTLINSLPHSNITVPQEEEDEYEYHHIDLNRETTDSNWGIRLIGGAEVDRAISIGSIVFGGAASKNGQLKSGDEIISINGINVVGATHQRVVELISTCRISASLVIRRKKFADACDVVLTRNLDEGFGFVIISSGNCALIGRITANSPADKCQQLHVKDRIIAVNGRYITPNMRHPDIVNMIKECGSTLRLRIIPVDCYAVELIKNAQNDNFGFSIRGGSEYDGTPLYILRVAQNGLARDLLNVGDQILEINNIPTVGMTHQQAATIIKYSDPIVKLKLRRNHVTPPTLLVDSPRALQKLNQVTAEMRTLNSIPTPTNNFATYDTRSLSSCEFNSSSRATSTNTSAHQSQSQSLQSTVLPAQAQQQAQQQISQSPLSNHASQRPGSANLGPHQSMPLFAT